MADIHEVMKMHRRHEMEKHGLRMAHHHEHHQMLHRHTEEHMTMHHRHEREMMGEDGGGEGEEKEAA